MQFKRLHQQPNHIDRVIGNWQLVEIHQIPNPFNVGNEVDFWCCDDKKLVLLRLRHQPYQKFTTIHPNVKKQTPAYWIAELPIEQSQKIDDEFLLKILKVFDKNLD